MYHYIDLVPVIAVGEALALPNPHSFEAVGWLLVAVWVLVKIADGILNFYKRHIKQSMPLGDWVSNREMAAFKAEVHNQLTADRAYTHEEIHKLSNLLQSIQTSGEAGREGLHNRLNTIVELVHYQRGQNEGLLKASEITANSADRAAKAAENAAARADELTRRTH